MDLQTLTIAKARAALDRGEYTAVELAQAYLDAIEKKNSELNVYLEVFDDVLEQAARADNAIAKGDIHPMTGIPIAVKDNILIRGKVASAASKMLATYVATYDATVIEKLKEQHCVFLGRANMDEFAMGGSTENSAFGVTKNPHDVSRVPGGSSGGSAAAVAGGLALAALGTDTGGSIRQPASFCGVAGFKSTYGAVSRYGAIAMGSSLDQIGPLTKTVADARILFEAIRGEDERDSTTLPARFFTDAAEPKTIGVPRAFLKEGVDPVVLENFEQSLAALKNAGHEIVDIDVPNIDYALATYYIIMPAESSTNLARFDGVRYGTRVLGKDAASDYAQTRSNFGKEVRRRILLGTFVLSAGYADAYYRKATAVRELIRSDFKKAFETVDVIAVPTSPTPAFQIGEKIADPLAMYTADIFTVPVNIAGVPAISVPSGTVPVAGKALPLAVQFIGAHGADATVFSIAEKFETIRK